MVPRWAAGTSAPEMLFGTAKRKTEKIANENRETNKNKLVCKERTPMSAVETSAPEKAKLSSKMKFN